MILSYNQENHFNSEYLLLDKNGERLHDFSVNNVLRRLNKQIGTIQKGNHGIRKTVLSKLMEAKELTSEDIRTFAGHEDIATTEKYYYHSTVSWKKRRMLLKRHLHRYYRSVTNCNQWLQPIEKRETL